MNAGSDLTAPAGAAPLRILHVFRAPMGGLFRHVLDLSRGQIARGHAVGVFCDSTAANAYSEGLLESLAPELELGLHRVRMQRNPHPRDITVMRRLRSLAATKQADVLHGHGAKGGLFARLAPLALRNAPLRVYTPHGGSLNYEPGTGAYALFMRAERLLESQTDLFSFESDYARQRYETHVCRPRALANVVRNGIFAREFEPVTPAADASDFLYVGEFRALKGLDILLQALAQVRAQTGRTPTATLVGSGADRDMLQQQATDAGLGGAVTFLAPQPIRQALARGRAIVVPSRAESLPYVVLESAGAGAPMIATRVGGIPEVFGPYADRLIPAGDAAALTQAMLAMLERSEARRRSDAAALVDYMKEHFTVDGMVDGITAGYRAALARRAANIR